MKRILFYSENFCDENIQGGLEVATFRIAQGIKTTGRYEIYNAFRSKSDGSQKSIYADVVKLSKSDRKFKQQLIDFIKTREIDVVVNMSRFFRHGLMAEAAKESGRDVKIIFMQHFAPGSEFKKGTFAAGRHLLGLNPWNPLYWLRASVYPLLKLPRNRKLPKIYRSTYEQSDKVVLLSAGDVDDYVRIAGVDNKEKFDAIQNIFEAPANRHDAIFDKKKKKVLILSRMDEIQKRISLALKIWRQIEDDPELDDWSLDIVGMGHNIDIAKRMAKKLKLRRATFHGWQKREPFLTDASVLMMTSEYEGLPLSLLEAQGFGTVPIAFGSYASIFDVIDNDVNGVIIDDFGDVDTFAQKLKLLMKNDPERKRLAETGLINSRRFSEENIVAKWIKMLDEL